MVQQGTDRRECAPADCAPGSGTTAKAVAANSLYHTPVSMVTSCRAHTERMDCTVAGEQARHTRGPHDASKATNLMGQTLTRSTPGTRHACTADIQRDCSVATSGGCAPAAAESRTGKLRSSMMSLLLIGLFLRQRPRLVLREIVSAPIDLLELFLLQYVGLFLPQYLSYFCPNT